MTKFDRYIAIAVLFILLVTVSATTVVMSNLIADVRNINKAAGCVLRSHDDVTREFNKDLAFLLDAVIKDDQVEVENQVQAMVELSNRDLEDTIDERC